MNVLVVDDDAETCELVARALERAGQKVRTAPDLASAREALAAQAPDVLVLDVMLPDGSGLDLCAALRAEGNATPVLFLSARGAVSARVDGLDAGGDDYLAKPFAVRELVARVRALGRRGPALQARVLRGGELELDLAARRAELAGVEVPLTAREWAVIEALAARRGRAVGYDELLESAWGEVTPQARASLEVIIVRLRRKLARPGGPSVVRTLRGTGYALDMDAGTSKP